MFMVLINDGFRFGNTQESFELEESQYIFYCNFMFKAHFLGKKQGCCDKRGCSSKTKNITKRERKILQLNNRM